VLTLAEHVKKKPIESVSGSYTPLVHTVLDSVAYKDASFSAKALLNEVMRQHTGSNNGHLQLCTKWLFTRGWRSAGTIQKAKEELIERGLIVKTRLGGLNAGADQFALTWVDISNFLGLDICRRDYHKGAWSFMDKLPIGKKHKPRSEKQNGSVPESGTAQRSSVPKSGTKKAIFDTNPIPKSRNNECLPLSAIKKRKRIVGRKGRSGISVHLDSNVL